MMRYIVAVVVMLACTAPVWGAGLSFNDPQAAQQWYLDQMRFPEAWARIQGLNRVGQVTVAVIDSGFQTNHPDLQANLSGGINIVDGSSNIGPVHPHGTAVGGLPGAQSGNAIGISQAALTANVMPIRVSNRSDGGAYLAHIAAGIRYAADHGARVINISYSGVQNKMLQNAAKYANSKGAVVFMAAGNDGAIRRNWVNHPHIMAVGSVGPNGVMSSFSNRGAFIDFAAPGQNIRTLYPNGQYADWNGTSFASPLAASVAALMLVANPELAPWQIRGILRQTATGPGHRWVRRNGKRRLVQNWRYGWGQIDALAAVERALQTQGVWPQVDPNSIATTWIDWNSFGGLTVTAGTAGARMAFLEGFLSQVPEPGTGIILLVAGPLLLRRRVRSEG